MWSAINWELRDPTEKLAAAERRVSDAIADRNRIARSMT
jgi:hypothetical protein